MSSEIEICNLALSHVGAYRISALTDATKEAIQCNLLYEPARDSVLEAHDWGFARKEATLALLPDTYSGWDYAYAYPSDCINPRKIFDPTGDTSGSFYDRETDSYIPTGKIEYEIRTTANKDQNIILTNQEDAILIYTTKIINPTLFTRLFIKALSYTLASDLAQPLRKDKALQEQMEKKALSLISGAESIDANSDYKKPNDSNSFVRARL